VIAALPAALLALSGCAPRQPIVTRYAGLYTYAWQEPDLRAEGWGRLELAEDGRWSRTVSMDGLCRGTRCCALPSPRNRETNEGRWRVRHETLLLKHGLHIPDRMWLVNHDGSTWLINAWELRGLCDRPPSIEWGSVYRLQGTAREGATTAEELCASPLAPRPSAP